MSRQMFVNLPIKNMERTQAFFTSLGFGFNPQFTNEQGACMVVSEDNNYVMLLVEPFFQGFTNKPITDATQGTEVLICLSCESREEVDSLVSKALAAGGTALMLVLLFHPRSRWLARAQCTVPCGMPACQSHGAGGFAAMCRMLFCGMRCGLIAMFCGSSTFSPST